MIEAYAFGRITVDGRTYTRDIKIVGGMVVPQWWRKNGHRVEADDINDILDAHPDILVIGAGDPGLMKPSRQVKALLEKRNIELVYAPTAEAVSIYNQLVKERKHVAAGFHLTC